MIFIYSLIIVFLMCLVISVYFYIKYDYFLFFPVDYFQSHDYIFAALAFIIFGKIFSQKDLKLTKKDNILICCCLTLIVLIAVVPTSEKAVDNYQYHKAEKILAEEENHFNAAITYGVSSCRENAEYRKTYQIFECEADASRLYYMFVNNTTSEEQHVVVHLSLLDQNNKQVDSFSSTEMTLQPGRIYKVLFDSDVFNRPDWMQHSFRSSKQFEAYQYEIEWVSNDGSG
ncbi:hypothetical protein [Oceanobacillus timonensis]|uniref:hypothetical protein n=1 Tax=Oceanobacillus timonensis TaxID=1926285 RepID=UPI0015C4DCB6|nr:hypothetical protein [Oceanobacillus timonensis]